MLTAETKRRIDPCRDILVGKLPLPTDQVELVTLAPIYKFTDDLDEPKLVRLPAYSFCGSEDVVGRVLRPFRNAPTAADVKALLPSGAARGVGSSGHWIHARISDRSHNV